VEYYSYDRNEYYWVGYSISNYARYYGYSYKYIFSYVSLLEMIELYSKYHEIDDRHLINKLDSLKRKTISNLKRIRESKHLSQSELASLSSMSLRTLQAYEQKQKDINKADVATMVRISKILECDIEDLLEH
jgi:DNA-binding transcriptional regulator YiaG